MIQPANQLPLEGIRVMDLGQFIAMPFCTLWMAWLGAEVIAIESRRRFTSRTAPPFAEGHGSHPNASGYFNVLYGSKKSCTVDMTTAAGRDIVRRLAGKVDVVVDNFSTGVLEKLGLGYESIVKINPSIVMASNGAFGRTGPMRNSRGLHSAVNLFSGVADVTGYIDGHPRILGGVIPDPLSGTYSNFAILAALHNRKRTGRGQFIDLAMYEAMMTLIPEAVINYTLNGIEPQRTGNRDHTKAPHGIYRCKDADTWLAISVGADEEWASLCRVAGHPEWLTDPHFTGAGKRQENVAALDLAVEAWTRGQDVYEATDALQTAGVAAGPVLRCDELLDDEQLLERGLVITTDHPVVGERRQFGIPWRMDSLAVEYRRAPLLGEHTHETLTKLLGIDEATFASLEADGVLA
jgi:crotonobetainyl-CoA:carnitine CoA-transferase CaiB-like acyl-CoA transferase